MSTTHDAARRVLTHEIEASLLAESAPMLKSQTAKTTLPRILISESGAFFGASHEHAKRKECQLPGDPKRAENTRD